MKIIKYYEIGDKMIQIGNYTYKTEEELINKFKEALKSKFGGEKSEKFSDYTEDDFQQYNHIMQWFKNNDYFIEEFPNVVQSQLDLKNFGYDMIRSRIMEKENIVGSVTWEERRQLINSLTIKRRKDFPAFDISAELNNILRDISTNKGELHYLPLEQQLALLNNAIEYLLKKDNGFESISSEIFFGYIGNDEVKQFRSDTQIFRHASERSLQERKTWTQQKKEFYVRLGIILITNIYSSKANAILR